jgi:hypothetical protein
MIPTYNIEKKVLAFTLFYGNVSDGSGSIKPSARINFLIEPTYSIRTAAGLVNHCFPKEAVGYTLFWHLTIQRIIHESAFQAIAPPPT